MSKIKLILMVIAVLILNGIGRIGHAKEYEAKR